jgi:hypothetical protein
MTKPSFVDYEKRKAEHLNKFFNNAPSHSSSSYSSGTSSSWGMDHSGLSGYSMSSSGTVSGSSYYEFGSPIGTCSTTGDSVYSLAR